MRIYWIEDGKRCGPATVPDVIAKIQLGELTADTLGWHRDCEGWRPLRELPALADFLRADDAPAPDAEPPAEAEPAPAEGPEQPAQGKVAGLSAEEQQQAMEQLRSILPSPLVRLVARLVDMGIYATLALYLLHALQVPYRSCFLPNHPLFWLPMPVLEALLLYSFRTTPGKQWMGIRMSNVQGRWSYGKLLIRSILVVFLGLGCMIPPVYLITMAFSCYLLTKRGITPWDLRCTTLPVYRRRPRPLSLVAAACFLFICLQLCGQFMLPWMPDFISEMRLVSPEWADFMEQMLQAR